MKELIEELRYLAGVIGDADGAMLCQAADAIESQATTIARYETTAENYELLQAKVDEQAREIERLTREAKNDAIAYKAAIERQEELRAELAALKAQPSGVVMPPHVNTGAAIQSVLQAIGIDGDVSYHLAGQVWNACLDEVARLNSSPVSASFSAPAPGECVAVPVKLLEKYMHESFPQENNRDKWFLLASQIRALLAQQGKAAGDE